MAKYVIDTDNCPFKIKTLLVMGWKEEDGLERFKAIRDDELDLLDSDYINEHFSDLLDNAYAHGKTDAEADLYKAKDEAYKQGFTDCSKNHAEVRERICAEQRENGYQKGLTDAWECAKKLFSDWSDTDIKAVFPGEWKQGGFRGLMALDPKDALDRITRYEQEQIEDANDGLYGMIGEIVEAGYSLDSIVKYAEKMKGGE